MTKSELIKRYTLFIISLFFSALGVATGMVVKFFTKWLTAPLNHYLTL